MKQAKAVIILFICITGAVSSVFEGVLFLSETILNPYLLIKREKNDNNKGIVDLRNEEGIGDSTVIWMTIRLIFRNKKKTMIINFNIYNHLGLCLVC